MKHFKNNQSGFANIAIVLVIFAVLAGSGAYVVARKNSAKPTNLTYATPIINSVSPTSGKIGTSVTVTGTGFTSTKNSVKFGGGHLNELSSNGTQITFAVPDGMTPCPPNEEVCTELFLLVTPGSYPISVINANGTSNIVNFTVKSGTAVSPSPTLSPGQVTIAGEIVCLPKKGTGPQTEECAFGLRGNDGKHYGLVNLNQADLVSGKISTGKRVSVSGVFTPDNTSKYNIVGSIKVSSIAF